MVNDFFTAITNAAILLMVFIFTIGAWVQHVISCIARDQIFLLLLGILCPPVGWIHGIGIWLGVF